MGYGKIKVWINRTKINAQFIMQLMVAHIWWVTVEPKLWMLLLVILFLVLNQIDFSKGVGSEWSYIVSRSEEWKDMRKDIDDIKRCVKGYKSGDKL